MTASDTTLASVSDLVRIELAGFLSDAFVIAEVTSEFLPTPDGDDYIRTTVILEDDHPELDPRAPEQILLAHGSPMRGARLRPASHCLRQQKRDPCVTTSGVQPPEPINWMELIAVGRATLVPQSPAIQPAPAAMRRAISAAYYAMFHALAANNADVLIGPARNQLTTDAWIRIYRGLNHNHARSQLQQNRTNLSAGVRTFADLFRDLQNERHNADYNPQATFTIQAATTWLDKAEATITDFLQTGRTERAAIAILTLVRSR